MKIHTKILCIKYNISCYLEVFTEDMWSLYLPSMTEVSSELTVFSLDSF
jgi:hypothetical protein